MLVCCSCTFQFRLHEAFAIKWRWPKQCNHVHGCETQVIVLYYHFIIQITISCFSARNAKAHRHCCCRCRRRRLLRPQYSPSDLMIPLEVHARSGHSVRLKDLLYIILFGQTNKKPCTAERYVLFVIECSTLSRPCNWKMYAVCNNGTQIYAKCNSYESLWQICMSMTIKMV